MSFIGVDIGGTKILGALFDKNGLIVLKEKKPSKGEEGFKVFLKQLDKVIDTLIRNSKTKVKGIGIGFPGIISKDGHVDFSPNLPIEDFHLVKHIEKKYNIPCKAGNDVNLGTYGEYKELGFNYENVIGLFPGTGLGGGIIINKKLYIGKGFAAELGHICVEKDGDFCNCGNKGCLEAYASKKGIINYILKEEAKGRICSLTESAKSGVIKSSRLLKAYNDKEEVIIEAMDRFTDYLGLGIGIVMNTFNPDLILIGGGVIDAFGSSLLRIVHEKAKQHTLSGIYSQTDVKKSKLSDDAVIYGAYHLIKSNIKK